MLLRKYVEGITTEVYKADAIPRRLQVWSAPLEVVSTRPRSVYLHTDPDKCNQSLGVPLPYGMRIDIDLEPGEALYAWAYEAIALSASVLERNA